MSSVSEALMRESTNQDTDWNTDSTYFIPPTADAGMGISRKQAK